MKLNVVKARQGSTWVRQGIRTFWRQPLALSGLFLLFMALASISSMLPYGGTFLGLMFIPAASLGLMAAAREADLKRFPMPSMLIIGFKQGAAQSKQMVLLGFFYALLFCLVLAKVTGTYGILLLFKRSSDSSIWNIRLACAEQCNGARSGILLVFVIAAALAANRLRAVAVAVLHSLLRPLLGTSGFKTHEGSRLSLFRAHKPRLFLNIAGLLQLRQSVLQRHRFTLDGSKIWV